MSAVYYDKSPQLLGSRTKADPHSSGYTVTSQPQVVTTGIERPGHTLNERHTLEAQPTGAADGPEVGDGGERRVRCSLVSGFKSSVMLITDTKGSRKGRFQGGTN